MLEYLFNKLFRPWRLEVKEPEHKGDMRFRVWLAKKFPADNPIWDNMWKCSWGQNCLGDSYYQEYAIASKGIEVYK